MVTDERIPPRTAGLLFVVLVVLSLLLMILSTGVAVIKPKQTALRIGTTVQSATHTVSTFFSRTVTSIRELSELRQEYLALLDRVRSLEAAETDIRQLRDEITRLEEILGFHRDVELENMPARVVGKDPASRFASFVIDKGSRDGVRENQAVIAVQEGNRGLAGKVRSVSATRSMVVPIFDPSNHVAARLLKSRYEGLVSGAGDGSTLVMRYVDDRARASIQFGDAAITSGMNSVYPAGIRIGTVDSIQSKTYETTLELTLDPVIDFERLEYVFVLRHAEEGQ
ncbi:MAG: rod shape-determining protein MreC [Spirochaetaceae bacterium]